MKFVFVSHNYSPDIASPEAWFERIRIYAGALACLSKEHSVTRIERINYEGSCLHDGIRYLFTGYGPGKLYFPWRLHRLVRDLSPDIVVVHGLHYPLQVIQLRLRLGPRVKIIAQNHAEKPFRGIKKYWQLLADHFVDAYFFASRGMGEDWVRKGNLRSIAKIREVMEVSSVFYPIEREAARAITGSQGRPLFLWVGRLDENKNPLMVVRAFLRFARSNPGARLYMIYHTAELLDSIEKLLDEEIGSKLPGEEAGSKLPGEETGSREVICLVGKLPHAELLYWYNSADFIVSGSWYEGSGAAVCEAMSCGCIPVLTDIFSFRAMTGDGGVGRLYEPGNETDLLAALDATVRMDLSEERGKVLERFRSTLSFEAIAEKIREAAASL
jgi:glycosyltransferase involved in cell wall biosynthesis